MTSRTPVALRHHLAKIRGKQREKGPITAVEVAAGGERPPQVFIWLAAYIPSENATSVTHASQTFGVSSLLVGATATATVGTISASGDGCYGIRCEYNWSLGEGMDQIITQMRLF
ncbi:hypothetical protein R6Q59_016711 [Mikania micrantha]